jgi:hypothetical protein
MTTFNQNLRMFEARIVLTIRLYSKLTRAKALEKLRSVTGGRGIDTVFCYQQLKTSSNQGKTINQLFGI